MEAIVNSVPVYYEEYGEGTPLLMLHGRPLDHRHMVASFEPLFQNRQGWRRFYPDLPGMGKTPGPDWINTYDQMLEIVIGFMEAVAPGQRFAVAGVSYGGFLTLGMVHQQGVVLDGVMLVVPKVEPDKSKQNLPEFKLVAPNEEFLAALTPEETNLTTFIAAPSMELLEMFRRNFDPAGAIADFNFLKKFGPEDSFSFPVDHLPEPFPAPALILAGRQDPWCGYREAYLLLDDYPRATYAVLDRAGHGLYIEQKLLFETLANEWLDRVEEYKRQTTKI